MYFRHRDTGDAVGCIRRHVQLLESAYRVNCAQCGSWAFDGHHCAAIPPPWAPTIASLRTGSWRDHGHTFVIPMVTAAIADVATAAVEQAYLPAAICPCDWLGQIRPGSGDLTRNFGIRRRWVGVMVRYAGAKFFRGFAGNFVRAHARQRTDRTRHAQVPVDRTRLHRAQPVSRRLRRKRPHPAPPTDPATVTSKPPVSRSSPSKIR